MKKKFRTFLFLLFLSTHIIVAIATLDSPDGKPKLQLHLDEGNCLRICRQSILKNHHWD